MPPSYLHIWFLILAITKHNVDVIIRGRERTPIKLWGSWNKQFENPQIYANFKITKLYSNSIFILQTKQGKYYKRKAGNFPHIESEPQRNLFKKKQSVMIN